MLKKILVAFDRSAIGQQVFDQALSLAKATDACLMLLYVLSLDDQVYPEIYSFPTAPVLDDEIIKSYQKQWDLFKKQCLDWLKMHSDEATAVGVKTEFTLKAGSPGRSICDLARTWEADLIVTGRRGNSGLSELFLGSVSNYVLHHASCSVLVVQGQVKPSSQL